MFFRIRVERKEKTTLTYMEFNRRADLKHTVLYASLYVKRKNSPSPPSLFLVSSRGPGVHTLNSSP